MEEDRAAGGEGGADPLDERRLEDEVRERGAYALGADGYAPHALTRDVLGVEVKGHGRGPDVLGLLQGLVGLLQAFSRKRVLVIELACAGAADDLDAFLLTEELQELVDDGE